jgi:hypothetical protein
MGGTFARMGKGKVGKPEEKRPLGRPRCRWEGNIKISIKKIGLEGLDWILMARDRDKEQAFVKKVMKFSFIQSPGDFIDLMRKYYFLEKDSAPWS